MDLFLETVHKYLSTGPGGKRLKITNWLLLTGVLLAGMWAVYFAGVTVSIRYPLEYREGAALVMTEILLRGGNPFSLEYQPLGMNNYGIGYSLAALPFAALFGNTLLVHRLVSLLFILLTFLLIFKTLTRRNIGTAPALACGLLIVIPLMSRGAVGATPTNMGAFLFLAAVLLPFQRAFVPKSLFFSAVLCLLAFFTKPYFVLAFGIVASYLFLFVSKKKSFLYGAFFALIFAAAFLAVRYIWDLYFINTVIGNMSNTSLSPEHLRGQLQELMREGFPSLIVALLMLLAAAGAVRRNKATGESRLQLDVQSFDRPMIPSGTGYFFFFFVACLAAFVFLLGPHAGSYMTYAYQLVAPPFFLWLFDRFPWSGRLAWAAAPLFILNLALLCFLLLNPALLSQRDSVEWARVYEWLDGPTHILNSSALAPALVEGGMLPIDSGQTKYFYSIDAYPYNRLLGPDYRIVKADGRKYRDAILSAVQNREYDAVILDNIAWVYPFIYDDLVLNYSLEQEVRLDMPQTGQTWIMALWKPLPR